VGWICALSTELTAARAMLDEEREKLQSLESDENEYALGRVGDHNVVLACLPISMTGNNSAAAVAKDMMHSFQSIRFGLMVGIDGGVPSDQNDIRLGDVVVSKPTGTDGGVV
jgi:nucleoside phosphorylase